MSTQTPEQVVIETKAKLFDALEEIQALRQSNQELSVALQEIATVVQVQPNEEGTVQLVDIVNAVKAVAPIEAEQVED